MRIGIKEVTNPLEVLECLVAFDSRDYGTAKRDRMLYAIILGWDDASYKSFGWSEEEIKEWKQMRERFERLKEVDICTADVVAKSDLDLLKSTITHKEEDAYNKGYADAKADILEKLQADIARDEVLAEYGDELFEGRIAGFKAVMNYILSEEQKQ